MSTWNRPLLTGALATALVGATFGLAAAASNAALVVPTATAAVGNNSVYHRFTMEVRDITGEVPVAVLSQVPAGNYVVTFSTTMVGSATGSGSFRCNVYNAVAGGSAVIDTTTVPLKAGAYVPLSVTVPVALKKPGAIAARCRAAGSGFSVTASKSDLTAVKVGAIRDF